MSQNEKLEYIISAILITGVAASLVTTTWGLTLYCLTGCNDVDFSDRYRVSSESFFFYVLHLPTSGAAGLMAAGLVILMLTPYIRVVASLVYFLAKRDFKYTFITAFVLIILTISLIFR
ncbi:MAG: DUF1634 domain-containing protein [Candidatus Caldarchaeum sp.]|jgi:uncharacterized membrane protein